MKKPLPTAERVRELLRYDPESGVFTRRIRTSTNGTSNVGDIAGGFKGNGYVVIKIDGKQQQAHRLAWVYMTGEWPENDIDHINGVKTDNRWANLRAATRSENIINAGKPITNTSGFKGVSWHKGRGKKWKAQIQFKGKSFTLGYFDDPELAALCYAGASRILYGDFSHATINIVINNYFDKENSPQ